MSEAQGQDTVTLRLRTAAEFFDALGAPDLAVRVATFEAVMAAPDKALAFGRHHGKDIVDVLTELAHTAGEFTSRRMAVAALARFDDPRAVEALKKQYCFTDDPETLALIAHRLTHEPATAMAEFLTPFLSDGPRSPRARIAADVLAERSDLAVGTRVRAALLTGRADVDPPALDSESAVAWRSALDGPLAARARDALRGQGLDAFIIARGWWGEMDDGNRAWLVEWGLERFAPYAAELVMRALASGPEALRLAAMRGIRRMGPGGAIFAPALDSFTAHANRDIRLHALWLCASVERPLERLEGETDPEIRAALIRRAADRWTHPDLDRLVKLLDDSQWPARAAATDALIAIGEPSIGPAKRGLKSPSENTRAAAAQILLRLGRKEWLTREYFPGEGA